MTYENAKSELEKILEEIETGKISLDNLNEKLKRASDLLKFCKLRLRETDEQIQKIIEEL